MGAYGAALHARSLGLERSALLSAEALEQFRHTARPTTCGGCTNHCSLTINTFDGGRRFISGNRCQKPLGGKTEKLPNLSLWKYEHLRGLAAQSLPEPAPRGTIGIPLGLNMYENLPFWHTFFTQLGFRVVLSEESSRKLYREGQTTIPSDTVCYPAKLMHGHIMSLLDQGVHTIFYPCMSYNFNEKISDNSYNCPVVAYYPELLAANMPQLKDVRFLYPYFGLHRPRDFAKRAAAYFSEQFGIPAKETVAASRAAYEAYDAYKQALRAEGEHIIQQARAEGRQILASGGRPYHIDPEIGHGIDGLATSYGFCVLTEDAVAWKMGYQPRKVLNQWTLSRPHV